MAIYNGLLNKINHTPFVGNIKILIRLLHIKQWR